MKLFPVLDIPRCPGWIEEIKFDFSYLKRGVFGYHYPPAKEILVAFPVWPFADLILAHERWHAWVEHSADIPGYDLMSPKKGLNAWIKIISNAVKTGDWLSKTNRVLLNNAIARSKENV